MNTTTLDRTAPDSTTSPAAHSTETRSVGSYVHRDGARRTASRVGSYVGIRPTAVGSYTDRGYASTDRRQGSYTDSQR